MKSIYINSILYNNSLVDGPGIRTVLFLQGCDLHCKGCQNKIAWDIKKGIERNIEDLAIELKTKCKNRKLTISGGEPLMQYDALLELIKLLDGFDIALYTGHEKNEVPKEIMPYLTYLKTGPFKEELKTTVTPFVGSTNQKFERLKNKDETNK